MSIPPIERQAVLSHRLIHRGKKFDFEIVRVERAGRRPIEREMVRHPGAVVVVAVRDDGRVVLIRNTRWALSRRNEGPVELWECCAGTLDRDKHGKLEDPAKCAARELIEETGYEAGKIESLLPLPAGEQSAFESKAGYFFTTPGMTDERMYPFLATNLKHVGQHLEEDEAIVVETVTIERVWQMLDGGELRDAKSLLALMLAARKGVIPRV